MDRICSYNWLCNIFVEYLSYTVKHPIFQYDNFALKNSNRASLYTLLYMYRTLVFLTVISSGRDGCIPHCLLSLSLLLFTLRHQKHLVLNKTHKCYIDTTLTDDQIAGIHDNTVMRAAEVRTKLALISFCFLTYLNHVGQNIYI